MSNRDFNEALGRRITEARKQLGMNQTELAALLGRPFNQTTVSRVEAGTRPLRLSEALVLADAFDVSLPEIARWGS